MAIYHLNARIVKRSKGQSVVAKAAYNNRVQLTNENTGDRHDYRYRGETLFSGIFIPKDSPEWAQDLAKDRQALWSKVEEAEKRKDAQFAREVEFSLPHELTDKQREYLVKDFVRENFVRKGMIADVAVHGPSSEGDDRNYHAHVLLTMRRIEEEKFGEKVRDWNRKEQLQEWREKWEAIANRYLERYGHEERIDHRTLKEQGIDREPTIHVGPTATDFEREGQKTDRGNIRREIEERNKQLERLKAAERELSSAILEEHRRAARTGATLYDRADMASQQTDALRHAQEKNKVLNRDARPIHPDKHAKQQQFEDETTRKEETEASQETTGRAIGKEKDTPKDQAAQKRQHKRNTTEQTEYKQRMAEREALREQSGVRRQSGRDRDDNDRGRERER